MHAQKYLKLQTRHSHFSLLDVVNHTQDICFDKGCDSRLIVVRNLSCLSSHYRDYKLADLCNVSKALI